MVRRRITIEKIEDQKSRAVTFNKRKQGLLKKATELSILCDADITLSIKFNNQFYRFCSRQGKFEEMCKEAFKSANKDIDIAQETHCDAIMANVREKEMKEKEIMDCQQVYKRKREGLVLDETEEGATGGAGNGAAAGDRPNTKKRKLNNSQTQKLTATKKRGKGKNADNTSAPKGSGPPMMHTGVLTFVNNSAPYTPPPSTFSSHTASSRTPPSLIMKEYTFDNGHQRHNSPNLQHHNIALSDTASQDSHHSHTHSPVMNSGGSSNSGAGRPSLMLRPPDLTKLPPLPPMSRGANSPQQSPLTSPLSAQSGTSGGSSVFTSPSGSHSHPPPIHGDAPPLPSLTQSNSMHQHPHVQPYASQQRQHPHYPQHSRHPAPMHQQLPPPPLYPAFNSAPNTLNRRSMPPPTTVNSALPPPLIGADHNQMHMRVFQRTPPIVACGQHTNSFHEGGHDAYHSPPVRHSHFDGASQLSSSSTLRSHFGSAQMEDTHHHQQSGANAFSPSLLSGSGPLGLKNDKQFYQSLTTQSLQSIENVNASFKRGVGSGFSSSPPTTGNGDGPMLHTETLPRTHELENSNSVLRTSASHSSSPDEPRLSVRIPEDNDLKKPGPPVGYPSAQSLSPPSHRIPSLIHITEGPTSASSESPLGLDLRLSPSGNSGGASSLATPQSSSVFLKNSWSSSEGTR